MLTSAQLASYQKNGFLTVPKYLSIAEVASLRQSIERIISKADMATSSVFSSDDQAGSSDAYFLESAEKISCFYEEKALNERGEVIRGKASAINKIGHALHDLDDTFKAVSYKPALKNMAKQLGLAEPGIVQSQYIFKQPGIGGDVKPHQDATFLYTDPISCTGFWIALEKADRKNGCLFALPGSHRTSPLPKRFVRTGQHHETIFRALTDQKPTHWDLNEMQPIEVEAGDLVLLHGLCVHMSYANHSPRSPMPM